MMTSPSITLIDLVKKLNAKLVVNTENHSNSLILNGVAPIDIATENQLSFLTHAKFMPQAISSMAGAIIIGEEHLAKLIDSKVGYWIVSSNPYACFARAAQFFTSNSASTQAYQSKFADISPRALVPKSCFIGPFVSIASGVVLGENVTITAHVHLSENVKIDEDTIIYSNVSIYKECHIGARCIIHSNTVIGADGFGFAPDFNKNGGSWVKVPQTGAVIIGDDVEIGSCTTIDRGSMTNTVIERGCKLDNQIQIAHNVHIGECTAIAGNSVIAGSTKIGRNCIIGGSVSINGHINIADKVIISGGSCIMNTITTSGQFTSGFPAMPHHIWKKNIALLQHLDQLRVRLRRLEFLINKNTLK